VRRFQTRAHAIGSADEDAHQDYQRTTGDAIEAIDHAGSNILKRYRNGLRGCAVLRCGLGKEFNYGTEGSLLIAEKIIDATVMQ
jgi:hypothetical protein